MADGIFNESNAVHIVNSGTIRTADDSSSALDLQGTNQTVSLLRGSNLQGFVQTINDGLNLNVETGLNLALTLEPFSAGFDNLGIEAPFVLVGQTIAVVDPTGLALQADVLADLSDTILDGIFRHRAVFTCPCVPYGCGVWIQGIGSYRKRSHNKIYA